MDRHNVPPVIQVRRVAACSFPLCLLLLLLCLLFVSLCVESVEGTVVIPTTIAVSVNSLFVTILQKAYTAYCIDHPSFPPVTWSITSGSAAAAAAATSTAFDFVVSTNSLTYAQRAAVPTVQSYPFVLNSFAPFYNLPTSHGTDQLVLTLLTSCLMWRRNITHWDDTRIQATNPTLALPHQPIHIIMFGYSTESNVATSRMCNKVDPEWSKLAGFGITGQPAITGNVTRVTSSQGGNGLCSLIVDTPYSYGWVGVPQMATMSTLRNAALINQANRTINPTASATAQAFLEMAAVGLIADGSGFDLTNPQSAYAWPVSQSGWLLIDSTRTQSTCATKKMILEFILWFYSSTLVKSLAETAKLSQLPSLWLDEYDMINTLKKQMLCDGATLLATDTTVARYQGNPIIAGPLLLFTQLYTAQDVSYTYSFTSATDSLALTRLTAGEIDFAVVSTAAITDEALNDFTAPWQDSTSTGSETRTGGLIIPAYLTGVTIIYSLPTAITTLYASWSATNTMGLPTLYPLKIDLNAGAMMFVGVINNWLHPYLVQLNPQLTAWFARTGAPTRLETIACCLPDSTDPVIAGTILTKSLIRSEFVLSTYGDLAAEMSILTFWPDILAQGLGLLTLVEAEDRMPAKLIMQPGSVTYRMINSEQPALVGEFHVISGGAAIPPSTAAMLKCAQEHATPEATFKQTLGNPLMRYLNIDTPGCYPLTSLVSIAVSSYHTNSYSDSTTAGSTIISAVRAGGCTRAKHTLNFLSWLQSSSVMSAATLTVGVVRLGAVDRVRQYIIDEQLNTVTCDGKTILIVKPDVWEVSSSTTSFAIAASAIGLALCLFSLFVLWRYRMHPVIRSSSPIFMAQVLFGLILLLVALIGWASPVDTASCQTFAWLANLGFTLAFSPLFVKTYRIYSIFNQRKIKLVKITNSRLMWGVLGMLTFELVILSIWTAISPLEPIMYELDPTSSDGAMRHFTHCSVHSDGFAFVGIEAAFKGLLLFFGSLMGFSTRKVVSTFNESAQIAWAIYNVVFSGIIVTAIIVFIDTIGETLILMVLLLLVWVIYCTWAFVFIPKFIAVFGGEDTQARIIQEQQSTHASAKTNSSNGSNNSAFSFANVVIMALPQLNQYGRALETQLERVRRRVAVLSGVGGTMGEGHVLLGGPSGRLMSGDSPRASRSRGDGIDAPMMTHARGATVGGGSALHSLPRGQSNSRRNLTIGLSMEANVDRMDAPSPTNQNSHDDALKMALAASNPDRSRRYSRLPVGAQSNSGGVASSSDPNGGIIIMSHVVDPALNPFSDPLSGGGGDRLTRQHSFPLAMSMPASGGAPVTFHIPTSTPIPAAPTSTSSGAAAPPSPPHNNINSHNNGGTSPTGAAQSQPPSPQAPTTTTTSPIPNPSLSSPPPSNLNSASLDPSAPSAIRISNAPKPSSRAVQKV